MSKPSGAIDMTQGKPINLMLRFALPMMIGSIFQSLYSMVDSAVLGRFVGSHALAAIGATTSTTGLILLLATGVTSAISIVLSQYVGANDTDRVRKGIVASGWITLLLGVVLGLISVFAARPLMQLLKTPEDVIDMSVLYIQIVCGCGIAQFAYNAAASILRALGDSKTPLYFLILCSILNVILDLISVIGLNMGVAGVAVATVGSQAISAAICILVMFRKYPDLMPKRHTLRPDMPVSLKIFGMGAQMALQSLFLSVGMMVITRVINSYGSNVVAAFTVGSNVQNLAVMLFSNFSFGFSVYVGQNFGAKNAERIKLGVRQIFLLVGGLSIFAGALTLIFSEPLVSLYVKPNETEVIARIHSNSSAFRRGSSRSSDGSGFITAPSRAWAKSTFPWSPPLWSCAARSVSRCFCPSGSAPQAFGLPRRSATFWASSRCSSTITAAAGKSCSPSPPQNPQRRKIQQNGKSPKHLNRVSDFLFYLKISPQHHVQKHH